MLLHVRDHFFSSFVFNLLLCISINTILLYYNALVRLNILNNETVTNYFSPIYMVEMQMHTYM